MIRLEARDYSIDVDPERGGAILRLDWRGTPVLRPVEGASILDVACFPLVPFSNRIEQGRFSVDGETIALAPNFPGLEHPHPLHGFGWLVPWVATGIESSAVMMTHVHAPGEWPWAYEARQYVAITAQGVVLELALTNLSDKRMPAGLGFHPYFCRTRHTVYRGLHRGQWQTGADGIPLHLVEQLQPVDWWHDQPVETRHVDTVFSGRHGPLVISDPGRELVLTPSANLDCTTIYVPPDKPWFCVEPVSHVTDAVNRAAYRESLWLAPGDTMNASLTLLARATRGTAPHADGGLHHG